MPNKESIASNLKTIQTQIGKAQLLAVSKYSSLEDIKLAYECGQIDFGENKLQDLEKKSQALHSHPGIRWHFIGHLQSNKVKALLQIPSLCSIHSVDSIKLVKEIVKRKEIFKGTHLDLFFQMNTSGEKEKSGHNDFFDLKETIEFCQKELFDNQFRFRGLMTIGAIRTDHFEQEARNCFQLMKDYQKLVKKEWGYDSLLSMGMSQDYPIALEYGADIIRVGSKIFKDFE